MDIRDKNRNTILNMLTKQKNSNEIFEESRNFSNVNQVQVQKKGRMSNSFKNDILAIVESNGFDLKNGSVQSAVSLFFSNLDNI